MGPNLFILVCASLLAVFSQFGKRLSARGGVVWWGVAIFILIAAWDPKFFKPLTNILGIQYVSNFVLAGISMFLFAAVLQCGAEIFQNRLKLRSAVSRLAFGEWTKSGASEKILIVIPCYNEENSIADTLRKLKSQVGAASDFGGVDICVVNDGSSDATEEILKNIAPEEHVNHAVNVGVGGALLTGFRIANTRNYKALIQFDADGQHPAEKISELITTLNEHNADLVIGSRFSAVGRTDQSSTHSRRLGIKLISNVLWILNLSNRKKITDPTSGFRIYSSSTFKTMIAAMPDDYPEPESIAILSQKGLKIAETFTPMNPRIAGKSSLSGFNSVVFMAKVLSSLIGYRLRISGFSISR
jgi:hypothetical protein